MSTCLLLENALPGESPVTRSMVSGGLFQGRAFHELHARGGRGAWFEWVEGGQLLAQVHFTEVEPGHWRSPARGTFGGFVADPALTIAQWAAFVDAVELRLRERGARRLTVLPAPMAHDPQAFSNQVYVLRSRGFEIGRCDLNQSLVVDERPLSSRMSQGNRKRLAKCEREGYRCDHVGLGELPEVYAAIEANRAARGYTMSMSLAQLLEMDETCPGHLRLFACRGDAEVVAAAICLRLDDRVLYVFYWGDRPGHASLSPVVMVADAVYRHCQEHGLALLDVGTSTIDREPNPGLLHFKRGLGFGESLKLWMEKAL